MTRFLEKLKSLSLDSSTSKQSSLLQGYFFFLQPTFNQPDRKSAHIYSFILLFLFSREKKKKKRIEIPTITSSSLWKILFNFSTFKIHLFLLFQNFNFSYNLVLQRCFFSSPLPTNTILTQTKFTSPFFFLLLQKNWNLWNDLPFPPPPPSTFNFPSCCAPRPPSRTGIYLLN